MAKLKKRAPIAAPKELQRNIQQIYDDINDIINSINQFSMSSDEFSGKSGDIKVIKHVKDDGTIVYYIRAKTPDGWVQAEATSVG
jgi:hypothetical protein